MRDEQKSSTGPGRPREFDKAEALSAIMQVFWENGYEGTGLSDLLKATGLAKASLYSAFGNKQSMYEHALAHYEKLIVDTSVHALTNDNHSPQDRLYSFLNAPIAAVDQNGGRRGCFLCNASADRAGLDEKTAEMVRRGYDKMRNALMVPLAQLGSSDPSAHAALKLTTYSGLRVMARAGVDVETLKNARDVCVQLIQLK